MTLAQVSLSVKARDALLSLEDPALLAQCELQWRSGQGPGGQKRNKSRVNLRLVHIKTGVVATCGDFRSRVENQRRGLRRLRISLALSLRAEPSCEMSQTEHISPSLRNYLHCLPKTANIRSTQSLIGLAHFLDWMTKETIQGVEATPAPDGQKPDLGPHLTSASLCSRGKTPESLASQKTDPLPTERLLTKERRGVAISSGALSPAQMSHIYQRLASAVNSSTNKPLPPTGSHVTGSIITQTGVRRHIDKNPELKQWIRHRLS